MVGLRPGRVAISDADGVKTSEVGIGGARASGRGR